MKQIVSNECKANLEIIASLMAIMGGVYAVILTCYQKGIWQYNDQHQVVLPIILDNKKMLVGTFFVLFLLANALLLLKDRFVGEPYDWEMFGINSITFSLPFLLIGCLVSVFSKPLAGAELFASVIFGVLIGWFLFMNLKITLHRIRSHFQ